eukprot:13332485-Heterocapsa_arctica.AAC.1
MQERKPLQLRDAAARAFACRIRCPAGVAGRHDLVGRSVRVDAQAHDQVRRALDVAQYPFEISPMAFSWRLNMPSQFFHRERQIGSLR